VRLKYLSLFGHTKIPSKFTHFLMLTHEVFYECLLEGDNTTLMLRGSSFFAGKDKADGKSSGEFAGKINVHRPPARASNSRISCLL
ncbi:hypothetical protein, partial [Paenibacillus typhae]|uniref:hypothetical protein n=1 Tax=Paenibacillus typhae TaxID=1174501 RepID=UPI0039EDF97D